MAYKNTNAIEHLVPGTATIIRIFNELLEIHCKVENPTLVSSAVADFYALISNNHFKNKDIFGKVFKLQHIFAIGDKLTTQSYNHLHKNPQRRVKTVCYLWKIRGRTKIRSK